MERDKVIFRIDKVHKAVFALFPEMPGGLTGETCRAFDQGGQQFAAHIPERMRASQPAEYPIYKALADLLTKIKYNLVVVRRETKHMREVRKASANFGV